MRTVSRTPRVTTLLTAATLGVYLLVVVGATAALADAAQACSTWPLCSPAETGPSPTDSQYAIAVGHRVAAALVGLLVLAAAALSWSDAGTRVRAALATAVGLYAVQVAVGAFVATTGAAAVVANAHLLVGMAVFTALALALAWQLEAETGTPDETGTWPTRPDTSAAPDDRPASAVTADDAVAADAGDAVPAAATGSEPLAQQPTGFARVRATMGAYVGLMKPRLMWLLCLVASAGMALAAAGGGDLTVRVVVLTLGGGVLSIGASGTFNHVLERDVDRYMERTSDRPVATARVPVRNALAFGALLTVAAVALFAQVNLLAAALGFAAIVFYSVIYTLVLKPNTVQNIVIGGAAGAFPALIGSAAVTGRVGLPGLALAALIFLWTPAHFYNLALAYKDDYERGGFPMMPVVRGDTTTRKHVVYYLAATLLGAAGLTALTDLGWLFAATTVALGAVFLWTVVRLHREQTERAAFRAFHASNAYLGAVLLAVVLDAAVL